MPSLRSLLLCLLFVRAAAAGEPFVNWETPHVHPLDLTPNGEWLLAVNTPAQHLELYAVGPAGPVWQGSIPVGVDPVSVRARNNDEVWVVNHVSDTISVVDLIRLNVKRTISVPDEPCDVTFAGDPLRAFVSCSQVNQVVVLDPDDPGVAPQVVEIEGEDPRALAVSRDGRTVFAAIYESGNGTTLLAGGAASDDAFPPNIVNNPLGPYQGQNPPPNDGASFSPPLKQGNPTPPKVGLIVQQAGDGTWRDDNGADWTAFVSGPQAGLSGRPVGWELLDYDVAAISVLDLSVTYYERAMNANMAMAVQPISGALMVVGTDASNVVRFEPKLNGVFVQSKVAKINVAGTGIPQVLDLNPHLDYTTPTVPQAQRDLSIGDPRGVVWNPTGTRAYVTGMGSNNVVVLNPIGERVPGIAPIEVGEGPTGIVYHPTEPFLFVLNKFDGSLSVVHTSVNLEVARLPFHDPTPDAITIGRRHLYDTHETSGLGHVSCASCHIDARMDRLAWDLGDPGGDVASPAGQNLGAGLDELVIGFEVWHPMKGPMLTQTLQDIIGKEPLHWRGDRAGIEDFNPAFVALLGDDEQLTTTEMQEFEDFLATIAFPPNPYRDLKNDLPTDVPLPAQFTTGQFSPKGQPLPNGNAVRGLELYTPPNLLDSENLACSTCHTLPTGLGPDATWNGTAWQPIAPGPDGERHHALVAVDGNTNKTIKIPQLRNLHERTGFNSAKKRNTQGFGYSHDGAVDTLAQFLTSAGFGVQSDQDIADIVAFLFALPGSELPEPPPGDKHQPPGPPSLDTHAAVGFQATLDGSPLGALVADIQTVLTLAEAGEVGLIVKGPRAGLQRGYAYVGDGLFQSDRSAQTATLNVFLLLAGEGTEQTITVVPKGTEIRLGIDRDGDGALDRDELDAGADPADPTSTPGCGTIVAYGVGCSGDLDAAPRLAVTGCAQGGAPLTLTVEQGPPNGIAFLLVGGGIGAAPITPHCWLNVFPLLPAPIGPLPMDADGGFALLGALPAGITGEFALQAVTAKGGSLEFGVTNGVLTVF